MSTTNDKAASPYYLLGRAEGTLQGLAFRLRGLDHTLSSKNLAARCDARAEIQALVKVIEETLVDIKVEWAGVGEGR